MAVIIHEKKKKLAIFHQQLSQQFQHGLARHMTNVPWMTLHEVGSGRLTSKYTPNQIFSFELQSLPNPTVTNSIQWIKEFLSCSSSLFIYFSLFISNHLELKSPRSSVESLSTVRRNQIRSHKEIKIMHSSLVHSDLQTRTPCISMIHDNIFVVHIVY